MDYMSVGCLKDISTMVSGKSFRIEEHGKLVNVPDISRKRHSQKSLFDISTISVL